MRNLDEKAIKDLNISVKNTLVLAKSFQLATSKQPKSIFANFPKKQFPLNLSPLKYPQSNEIRISANKEPVPEFMSEYLNHMSRKKQKVKSKLLNYSKDSIRSQNPTQINPKSEENLYTSPIRSTSKDFYHDLVKRNNSLSFPIKKPGFSNSILARYSKSTNKYKKDESCLKISESRAKGDLRLLMKSTRPSNPRESLEQNYKKLKEIIKDPMIYNAI